MEPALLVSEMAFDVMKVEWATGVLVMHKACCGALGVYLQGDIIKSGGARWSKLNEASGGSRAEGRLEQTTVF